MKRFILAALLLLPSLSACGGLSQSNPGVVPQGASPPIEPDTAARLLSIANDLRGVATPLGAPLVGEIANVICEVVQRFRVGSAGAGPLVQMLYFALHKAHDAIGHGDRVEHEAEIHALLRELRLKIAADHPAHSAER